MTVEATVEVTVEMAVEVAAVLTKWPMSFPAVIIISKSIGVN